MGVGGNNKGVPDPTEPIEGQRTAQMPGTVRRWLQG